MKKVLTVLLAVVMMFAFSATAFAADYTDIDNCTDAGKVAINKLSALEVLEGKGDGKFDPAGDVTRAEMAKICTILAGKLDVAEKLMDKASNYTDVKVSVWYTGYVNEADALGIVQGDPAGTFRPNDNVTMAEAIAMLLRTAGYTDNLPGPWYIDYLNQAVEEGLVDDVDFVYNKAASREEVAIMAEALLDVDIVEWTTAFEIDDHYVVEEGYDVLEQAFGDAVVEGVVDAVVVEDAEYEEIAVVIGRADYAVALDTEVVNAELATLVGHDVILIANEDGEAVYIEATETFIEVQEAEVVGTAKAMVKLDGVLYDYIGADFVEMTAEDYDTVSLYAVINADGEVTYVAPDYIIAPDMYGEGALVTAVDTEEEGEYTVEVNADGVAIAADEDEIIALQDGERVYATDVEQGDVILTQANNGLVRVVADPSFTGMVEDWTDWTVTIDGEEYYQYGTVFTTEVVDDEVVYTDEGDIDTAVIEYLYDEEIEAAFYYNEVSHQIEAIVFDVTEEEVEENYAVILDTQYGPDYNGNPVLEAVELYTAQGTKVIDVADGVSAPAKGTVLTYTLNDDDEVDAMYPIAAANYSELEVNDNGTITVGNVDRTIVDGAILWNILDDYEIEKLAKSDITGESKVIASPYDVDEVEQAPELYVVYDEDGNIEFIAVTNMNAEYTVDYAIVDAISAKYVTLDGERLALAAANGAQVGDLVSYSVVDGEATLLPVVEDGQLTVTAYDAALGQVIYANNTENFYLADDCLFVDVNDDGEYVWADDDILEEDATIAYILNEDLDIEIVIAVQ